MLFCVLTPSALRSRHTTEENIVILTAVRPSAFTTSPKGQQLSASEKGSRRVRQDFSLHCHVLTSPEQGLVF